MLVALSGGGDSLALLHLLLEAGEAVQAAHLDHALRPESAAEVDWLKEHCQRYGVVLHTRRVDVHHLAERWGCGDEAAGRRARYAWLKRLAKRLLAVVCTAHTREDQAETLLMRVVQGCSVRGLRGIRSQVGDWLFRPLIGQPREQLRELLRQRQIRWLEDPTNLDTAHLRAWVRHDLLPMLKGRNPRVEESLCNLARSAGGEDYREAARLWRLADPQARLTRKHLAWLTDLKVGQRCSLPGGLTAARGREGLRFAATAGPPKAVPEAVRLPTEGRLHLDGWGIDVEISHSEGAQSDPWTIVLNDDVTGPLWLRGRREGERFGRAMLKKIFNELRIEPERRSSWPLLVDGSERVLWIVGQRARPEVLATGPGLRVAILISGPR